MSDLPISEIRPIPSLVATANSLAVINQEVDPEVWLILAPINSELSQLCQNLEQQNRTYLPGHTLFCYSNELPEIIRKELVPLKIPVKYREAIHAYPHNYSSSVQTVKLDQNRELLTLRSQLAYLLYEYYGTDVLYASLFEKVNSAGTYRDFEYTICSNEIACWSNQETLDKITQELTYSPITGPLLIHTGLFSGYDVPEWYIQESVRDLYELDQYFATSQLTLLEGPITGEFYLFYASSINVTEKQIQKVLNRIHQALRNYVQLKIFPRNTPEIVRNNLSLQITDQGQWSLPSNLEIPGNLSVFSEFYDQVYEFKDIQQLGSFIQLLKNQFLDFFPQIQFGCEFHLTGRSLTVRFRTRSLLSFLNFDKIYRAINPSSSTLFSLKYGKEPDEFTLIQVLDQEQNSPVCIQATPSS